MNNVWALWFFTTFIWATVTFQSTSGPLVLAFTGMPASGKGEAVEVAKRYYIEFEKIQSRGGPSNEGVQERPLPPANNGTPFTQELPVVRMGDLIWERVRELGLELTPENVGRVANEERQDQGPDVWALKTVERVIQLAKQGQEAEQAGKPSLTGGSKKPTSSNGLPPAVIIDGLRSPAELKIFRKAFGDRLKVISIVASSSVRASRVLGRGRVDDTQDMAGFEARDERELSWGLGEVMEMADYILDNEELSMDEFQTRVRQLLYQLLKTV